jgi:hypothetical protein
MKNFFRILFALVLMVTLIHAQDVPPSVGPAPYAYNKAPESTLFTDAIGTRCFTQISSSPTFQFGKVFLEGCAPTNIGAPFTITFPGGLVARNGVVYTVNQSSPFQLWSIDTVTGTHTLVFNLTGVPQANLTGLVWDGTTMYGVSTSVTQSQIFTVNMTTGACTPIGVASAVCAGAIELFGRPGAQYSLFATDIVADNLYKINKTTGVFTLVGPLGQNINFGQGGTVDPTDNTFYTCCYTAGPELRKIDTTTGALGPILCTYTAQATGLAAMSSAPPPPPLTFPNVLYYKFEQNPTPLTTPNCAIPPAGTNPAVITGLTLTSGGQFDSCLTGTGGTNARITTGWNCDLAAGSWTISFWVNNLVDMNPTYLFGDAGSTAFRCFYGGAAGVDNILFRGPFTDILVPCPAGPQVFHFVYDGTNIIIYRNGTLVSTNPRAVNMPTGTGFFVGGYSGFGLSGKMDEFRLIRRAYTPAEVSSTWNSDLGGCGLVGVEPVSNVIPETYSLSQNYPNPFNPTTNIKFAIPTAGNVKLVVYDLLGREVYTLVNEMKTAGNYVVDFDASELSSGVYFYKLETGSFTQTKKMLLVK